jgi:hypothetical protein
MSREKSIRATNYHQRPNARSALDTQTMISCQLFQVLCANSLTRSHQMLMAHVEHDCGRGWQ